MRPEVVAFRELDTLVRNLTDQLAGFRRRALASEARTRELELTIERLEGEVKGTRAELRDAVAARARAEKEAHAAAESERAAQALLARAEAAVTSASRSVEELSGTEEGVSDLFPSPTLTGALPTGSVLAHEVVRENEALRARLGEARERTVQLVQRVRFLRQQITTGGDR